MRHQPVFRGLSLAAMAAALLFLGASRPQTPPAAGVEPSDPIARGAYLVDVIGCNDCHTPFVMGPEGPQPDMSRMLSGHPEALVMPAPPVLGDSPWAWIGSGSNTAFAGPWGISYATNLTPEENTGLGIWTEDIFVQTLRTGRHWGQSRPILPPMPWQNYARLTDDDLRAIYSFLRSIPPVVNRVPEPVLAGAPGEHVASF